MLSNKKLFTKAGFSLILGISTIQVHATDFIKTIDSATYSVEGEITLNDWGFVSGSGRTAADFEPINGFDFNAIGQIQHVVTKDADGLTPPARDAVALTLITILDPLQDLWQTFTFGAPNWDANVSFYHWIYSTKGGSTFNNMLIDTDGDYFVAQDDMNFLVYDVYVHDGLAPVSHPDYQPDGSYVTKIAFQPYVLSDAKGWCGSVDVSNPGALMPMAGQLKFDFAFDVYFQTAPGVFVYSSTEVVRDFEMRSFGTLTIDVDAPITGGDRQLMTASAVVNNTAPDIDNLQVVGAPTDPNYYNLVSFMGGGVLDLVGQCGILNPDFDTTPGLALPNTDTKKYTGLIDGPTDEASCVTAGGDWITHAFPGKAYILRADGQRVIDAMDYATYSNLAGVPTVIGGVAYNNDENGVSRPVADLTGTPDAFTFIDQTGVQPDTVISSNTVPVTGLAGDTVISNTGGEYSINAAPFTSARGVVVNSDSVQVRTTSSSSDNTTVDAVLSIGSLSDAFSVSTDDSDGDGIYDSVDNCPNTSNANQADSGGVDSNTPDGIGDACQCGDISGDGKITNTDSVLIRRHLLGQPSNFQADFCDVNGDGQCTNTDAILIQRALLGLPPGLQQSCVAAGN